MCGFGRSVCTLTIHCGDAVVFVSAAGAAGTVDRLPSFTKRTRCARSGKRRRIDHGQDDAGLLLHRHRRRRRRRRHCIASNQQAARATTGAELAQLLVLPSFVRKNLHCRLCANGQSHNVDAHSLLRVLLPQRRRSFELLFFERTKNRTQQQQQQPQPQPQQLRWAKRGRSRWRVSALLQCVCV